MSINWDDVELKSSAMLVYTCPKCGENLAEVCIATNPPKYRKWCLHCGWQSQIEESTVVKVPYEEDPVTVVAVNVYSLDKQVNEEEL